jgi:alkylation response protein AidB-like acyl-CoA dehydrogenase
MYLAKFRSSNNAIEASTTALAIFADQGFDEAYPITRLHRDTLVLKRWGGSAANLITTGIVLLPSALTSRIALASTSETCSIRRQ